MVVPAEMQDAMDDGLVKVRCVLRADDDVAELARPGRGAVLVDRERQHVRRAALRAVLLVERRDFISDLPHSRLDFVRRFSLRAFAPDLLAQSFAIRVALLERCLANDPELRPSAADVAAALDGDTQVAPTRVLARHRARPWGRIALLVVLLAAVVVALAVTGFSGSGSAKIDPVPHGASAAQQAQNLGGWLQKYSK